MVKFLKARSEDVALVTVDADGMNDLENFQKEEENKKRSQKKN